MTNYLGAEKQLIVLSEKIALAIVAATIYDSNILGVVYTPERLRYLTTPKKEKR
ncbi:MAG: hypothetical protein PHO37_17140 [Kiritimatiellae bacterium]|nr:hypothetical protein [Kiritimatiellia bacterium]